MTEKLTDEKLAAIRDAVQMIVANRLLLQRNAYLSDYESETTYDMLTRMVRRINNRKVENTKVPLIFDRKGNVIRVGDIIHYWAGDYRNILQKYVAESLAEGSEYHKAGPNRFRAIGHDGYFQSTRLSLYELDQWSEVIGNIQETPIPERPDID